MAADGQEDIEVTRWTAAQAGLSLARQADAGSILDPCGNIDRQVPLFGKAAGATAFGLRFLGAEEVATEEATSGANIAIFFAKLIYIQLLWVPFAVAKELANKLNADELRSGGN